MMLSSLPTTIARTDTAQAFATRSFVRGSWQRACTATRGFRFGLSGNGMPATGKRPYPLSNTTIA